MLASPARGRGGLWRRSRALAFGMFALALLALAGGVVLFLSTQP